jgi:hemolysin activation/secretion protein
VARITLPLNGDGLSFSATTTYSDAHPGSASLAALHFASSGWTASGQLNVPLLRSRAQSLWLWAGFSGKWLSSDLATTPNSRDKIYAIETGATWTERDETGLTGADVTMAQGLAGFGATTDSSPLRSRQAGSGEFSMLSFDVSRLQRLTDASAGAFELFATISGQIASRGLLSPSQCGYGGAAFGRGFDNNEIVGDQCVMGSLELRFTPQLGDALAGIADGVQFFAMADAGKVRNLGTLGYGDKRSESAESVGAGLRFRLLDHVSMSVEYDKPLGRAVALEGNSDGRIFFQLALAD